MPTPIQPIQSASQGGAILPEMTLAEVDLHTDALGSPVAETDESGSVLKRIIITKRTIHAPTLHSQGGRVQRIYYLDHRKTRDRPVKETTSHSICRSRTAPTDPAGTSVDALRLSILSLACD